VFLKTGRSGSSAIVATTWSATSLSARQLQGPAPTAVRRRPAGQGREAWLLCTHQLASSPGTIVFVPSGLQAGLDNALPRELDERSRAVKQPGDNPIAMPPRCGGEDLGSPHLARWGSTFLDEGQSLGSLWLSEIHAVNLRRGGLLSRATLP
jgi:hypothetical protein